MAQRRLGRTGLNVSEVGLGAARLLGRSHDRDVDCGIAIVHRALQLGITLIDTAECYIEGRSEGLVAQALATQPDNPDRVLATKFGHQSGGFDFRADSVLASVRHSVAMLGVSDVDVLQLHTPPEPDWHMLAGPGGAFDGMRRAQSEGLTRHLGVAGANQEFLMRCLDTDLFDTLLIFRHFNALDQSARAVVDAAVDRDVGVLVGGPLADGLLGSARDELIPKATPSKLARLAVLDTLAAEAGIPLPDLAIRFLLSHPSVACCLAGPANVAELEATVAAAGKGPLPADLVEAIAEPSP